MCFLLQNIRENKFFQAFYRFILLAFVFLMPFWGVILPKLIFAWLVLWLIEGDFKNKFHKLRIQKIFFLFTGFYLLHAISLLYSDNIDAGLFDLEVKASILIMPFLVLSNTFQNLKLQRNLKIAFITGVIAALIICLIRAWYRTLTMDESTLLELYGWGTAARHMFFYTELSYFKHPSYFSMYIVFAAVLLLELSENKFYFSLTKTSFLFLKIIIILIFLVSVFLLSSKAGMIAFVVTLLAYGIYQLLVLNSKFMFLLYFLLFLFTSFFYYNYNPRVVSARKPFKDSAILKTETNDVTESEKNVISEVIQENKNDRLSIWYYSFEIIKDHYLTGVGSGDITDELIKIYEKHNLTEAAKAKLNIHNQYLETVIGQGILGLIWLLTILFWPITIAYQKKNFVYLGFIIIVGIHFLFESMLNTQAGVIFFAFFYALFFFTRAKESAV